MIKGYIFGDKDVRLKLANLHPRLKEEIRKTTDILAINLVRYVKEKKLSGQVLKNRTGTLRRSINQKVTDTGESVFAEVGTNKSYAKPHEYGFSGTVTVKEHLRVMKSAFGRPISPIQVTVKEHEMRVNLPERSFLRSSLAEYRDTIIKGYTQASQRAMKI